MSTFCISDLHGYPLSKFLSLLEKAGFSARDTLYVLGDIVDRNGDGGVELLLHVMRRENYRFILGNHEDMLLDCAFVLDERTDDGMEPFSPENLRRVKRYLRNGGGVTLESLEKLKARDGAAFTALFDFIRSAPVFAETRVNGRRFVLVHGGLKDFDPQRPLSGYARHDLVWERPKLETEYYSDALTVFGHTPTKYYGEEHAGKVLKTRTWINIDAGAASRMPPALLRLDDLEVFYGEDFD